MSQDLPAVAFVITVSSLAMSSFEPSHLYTNRTMAGRSYVATHL